MTKAERIIGDYVGGDFEVPSLDKWEEHDLQDLYAEIAHEIRRRHYFNTAYENEPVYDDRECTTARSL